MNFVEKKPVHPLLSGCVDRYWSLINTSPDKDTTLAVDLPDGCVEYIFNGGSPYFRQMIKIPDSRAMVETSAIAAQRIEAVTIDLTGSVDVFCIRFKPYGFFQLAGNPLSDPVNYILSPSQIFGSLADELEKRILKTPDFESRVEVAERFLLKMIKDAKRVDPLVVSMIDSIYQKKGNVKIGEVTNQFNKSRRFLEIKFREQVGITIKDLCRISRFHLFLKLNRQKPGANFTELAYESGFYDQSHLIRECYSFTGTSPGRFLNSEFDFIKT